MSELIALTSIDETGNSKPENRNPKQYQNTNVLNSIQMRAEVLII